MLIRTILLVFTALLALVVPSHAASGFDPRVTGHNFEERYARSRSGTEPPFTAAQFRRAGLNGFGDRVATVNHDFLDLLASIRAHAATPYLKHRLLEARAAGMLLDPYGMLNAWFAALPHLGKCAGRSKHVAYSFTYVLNTFDGIRITSTAEPPKPTYSVNATVVGSATVYPPHPLPKSPPASPITDALSLTYNQDGVITALSPPTISWCPTESGGQNYPPT